MISVIIPTYNEQTSITQVLECLRAARPKLEVLVADGASTDETRARVEALRAGYPHPLRWLDAGRPRSHQLNAAAAAARGEVLLFLYADTRVPAGTLAALEVAARNPCLVGGNFELIFSGPSAWNRFFTWAYHVRRPLGIYYGDSGVWVRREVFEGMGGFKPLPIMDDYEFVRRLERWGKTACLLPALATSDRRWRLQGVGKTLASWILIQGLYSLGVPARYLARLYKPIRESQSK